MQVERDLPSGNESGARVSNAYATYLLQGNSPEKFGLIPHSTIGSHGLIVKDSSVKDGHA
jgi:hypothetical protein